jgi:protein ImuA
MPAPERSALEALRDRIRALETGGGAVRPILPLGLCAIDRALPGGGLARGAVHEVQGEGGDEEDGALAAGFAALALRRLGGTVLWCAAGADLGASGLAALGLGPERLVVARARREEDALWAAEEGLRAIGLAAIVAELATLPDAAGRRLLLAAEAAGRPVLLLRRWREGSLAARERERPSAAATRWRIGALPSASAAGEPGILCPRWRVELLRCRGGRPATWILEFDDAAHPRALPADAADGPAVAPLRRARA